jgi:FKBP-type peptidyl-prolyl cis-trans isomerase (trigger factor)
MGLSRVVRMPDFAALDIPQKQCRITLSDDTIFSDVLNRNRQLAVQDVAAANDDYVLIDAVGKSGKAKTIHIELGRKHFPDYEKVLLGCAAGQTLKVAVFGEETTIQVQTVKKVVEMPLTDETIAALHMPGIAMLADYRRQYIREYGDEKAEQIFHAIQGKLLRQLIQLMEVSLDESELNAYHLKQRAMIQSISGDVDQRLVDAYGSDGGKTPEECDRMFFEENKRSFTIYLWGKALAERNKRQMTDAERKQVLEYYSLIHGKNEDAIAADVSVK